VEGDDHGEAYTAIVRGELLSRETYDFAEAETVDMVAGNMCGAAMRGVDALPCRRPHQARRERTGTWETSNLPPPDAVLGWTGKLDERSRPGRMEESDDRVVPMKRRTKPAMNWWRRRRREGGQLERRQVATRAPDTAPDYARL